jgi:hypothetical protein
MLSPLGVRDESSGRGLDFPVCGSRMKTKRENYRYETVGLPGITRQSVEVGRCGKCGEYEVAIPRIEDLHRDRRGSDLEEGSADGGGDSFSAKAPWMDGRGICRSFRRRAGNGVSLGKRNVADGIDRRTITANDGCQPAGSDGPIVGRSKPKSQGSRHQRSSPLFGNPYIIKCILTHSPFRAAQLAHRTSSVDKMAGSGLTPLSDPAIPHAFPPLSQRSSDHPIVPQRERGHSPHHASRPGAFCAGFAVPLRLDGNYAHGR